MAFERTAENTLCPERARSFCSELREAIRKCCQNCGVIVFHSAGRKDPIDYAG